MPTHSVPDKQSFQTMANARLFMMLGIPGSGKSYFSRGLAQKLGAVHLNSDAMRMAIFKSREVTDKIYHSGDRHILNTYTFGSLNYASDSALQSGVDVIYDANNNTKKERFDTAQAMSANIRPIVVWVQTPQNVAVQRAHQRSETASERKLSAEEALNYIEKIAGEIELPAEDEVLITIDGTISFEDQYVSFENQLMELEK